MIFKTFLLHPRIKLTSSSLLTTNFICTADILFQEIRFYNLNDEVIRSALSQRQPEKKDFH